MGAVLVGVLLACAVELSAEAASPKPTSHGDKVVCYYTNWSHYRKGEYSFTPENIDPDLCTHIIYAFADIGPSNNIVPSDAEFDIKQGAYLNITSLKKKNKTKNFKVMISIGGWNSGSTRFGHITATESSRREFAKNVVRFLRAFMFDGLDLNWQHPTFREGGTPEDRQNYVLLAQALREEFEKEAQMKNNPRLLLSIAISHNMNFLPGYDIQGFNKYMDFISVICYDYHFSYEDAVNHHAPLYSLDDVHDLVANINYTIHFFSALADPAKLVLGIPTYGRSYTLTDPQHSALGSKADGPADQGPVTGSAGFFAYFEICSFIKKENWTVVQTKVGAVGPYAYKGHQWVGFDDQDMIRSKVKFVKHRGLAGVMFWTMDYDDFLGKCQPTTFPLIRTARDELYGDTDKIVYQITEEESPGERIERTKAKLTAERRRRYSAPGGRTPPPCRHLEAPPPRIPRPPPADPQPSGSVETAVRAATQTPPATSEGDIDANILADLIRLIEKAGGLKKLCSLLRQTKLLDQGKSRHPYKQEYDSPGNENTIVLETQRLPPLQIQISNSSIYIKEINVYTNGKP